MPLPLQGKWQARVFEIERVSGSKAVPEAQLHTPELCWCQAVPGAAHSSHTYLRGAGHWRTQALSHTSTSAPPGVWSRSRPTRPVGQSMGIQSNIPGTEHSTDTPATWKWASAAGDSMANTVSPSCHLTDCSSNVRVNSGSVSHQQGFTTLSAHPSYTKARSTHLFLLHLAAMSVWTLSIPPAPAVLLSQTTLQTELTAGCP